MTAQLVINQAGLSAGTANQARSDGLRTGALVTLSSVGPGDTHVFELLWAPEDDTTAASSFSQNTATTATFSPDPSCVGGTYRIKLSVTSGSTVESVIRCFTILTTNGLRIPALNERANETATLANGATLVNESEFNEPSSGPFASGDYGGWYKAIADVIRFVNAGGGGGGSDVVRYTDGGDLVFTDGLGAQVRSIKEVPIDPAGTNGQVLTLVGGQLKMATPSSGSGNVVGPSSAIDSRLVAFDGTTGKLVKDAGASIADFSASFGAVSTSLATKVAGPASATADNIAVFNGTTGKLVKDGGQTIAALTTAITSGDAATLAAAGDVHGPASATTDRIAVFNGTTGKIVKDGGQTIADVLAAAGGGGGTAAPAEVYLGKAASVGWTWNATSWTGLLSAITAGSFTDVLSAGITRSGSTFTVTLGGYYRIGVKGRFFSPASNVFMALRVRQGSSTLLSFTDYAGVASVVANPHLDGIVYLAAGTSFDVQYVVNANGGTTYPNSSDPYSMDSEPMVTCNISVHRISVGASSTTSAGIRNILDVNLVGDTAYTFVNGLQTWHGVPVHAAGLTGSDTAVVGASGLVITNGSNGFLYPTLAPNAPRLDFVLSEICPDFVLGVDKIAVRMEMPNAGTAGSNYHGYVMGRYPFVQNGAQHICCFQSSSPGSQSAHVWRDANQYDTVVTADLITGMVWESEFQGRITHQPPLAGVVSSDPNSAAFAPAKDTTFAQVAYASTANGGITAGYIHSPAEVSLTLFAAGTSQVGVFTRLRIDVIKG